MVSVGSAMAGAVGCRAYFETGIAQILRTRKRSYTRSLLRDSCARPPQRARLSSMSAAAPLSPGRNGRLSHGGAHLIGR